MAWYPEEQWEMISDSIDKKRTAASAFKQRTHCGKGGRVRFPSDFKTKKELEAMNGKCETYRMNDPMSWDEFKDMPNDLKSDYIRSLRNKFNVPDNAIAEMFDVPLSKLTLYLKDLKLEMVHDIDIWNKESFLAWRTGASSELVKENDISETEDEPIPVKYERRHVKWAEFKSLSDDEKREHIKWIRETFKASNSNIAEAMGVHSTTLTRLIGEIGIALGRGTNLGKGGWPKEEFLAWTRGERGAEKEKDPEVKEEKVILEPCICIDDQWKPAAIKSEIVEEKTEEKTEGSTERISATPFVGTLSFESNADQALNMLAMILGTNKVKLTVQWEVVDA